MYYVKDITRPDGKEYEVHLQNPDCCDYVHVHKQPCRHMVSVFHKLHLLGPNKRKAHDTIHKYWPKCFLAAEYKKMYEDRSIRKPGVYIGKFVGPPEDRIGPPKQTRKKPGRPKKERYRKQKQTVQTIRQRMPQVHNPEFAETLRFF